MEAYGAYKLYLGLKLHFQSDKYDFQRFNGGGRSSPESFYRRKDRWFFEKLVKRYKDEQVKEFFISNFIVGDKYGGLHTEESDTIYMDWKKRIQSVTYNFKSDITLLVDSVNHFDDLFVKNSQYPIILSKLYQGEIQLETFLILNQMLNFFPQFDKELDEYQWPVTRKLCNKYASFFNVDLKKYFGIVKKELDI